MNIESLKYPIGKFAKPERISKGHIAAWIQDIESFAQRLKDEVAYLDYSQLNTQYRPGGWTIRQLVHHCADSHMNSLMRFKLALTEESPVIKAYFEDRWAELTDSKDMPIASSLLILEGMHARWTVLLRQLSEEDLKRNFIHPEHGKSFSLEENIGIYAWHCNHHLAHITETKKRHNWQ